MLLLPYFAFWGQRGGFKKLVKDAIKRKELREKALAELVFRVYETGVVRNTHLPYDPVLNPREPVSFRKAERVAFEIAKRRGVNSVPLRHASRKYWEKKLNDYGYQKRVI